MPEACGGQHIIEAASCPTCSKVTSKFELEVTRELWGPFRYARGGPGKRKHRKRWPKTYTVGGFKRLKELMLPIGEYPAPAIFYRLPHAGMLSGASAGLDISDTWLPYTIVDPERAASFEGDKGAPLTFSFRHVPTSFGRLVLKVGYGHLLSQLPLGSFDALCMPYILGERPNVSFLVGARPINQPPEPVGYRMETVAFGTSEYIWLTVEVRFFADADTPTYYGVIGGVRGAEAIEDVAAKLGRPKLGWPDYIPGRAQ